MDNEGLFVSVKANRFIGVQDKRNVKFWILDVEF